VEFQRLVAVGELDLAFALLPAQDLPLESVELLRDPYVLLVGSRPPLAYRPGPPAAAELEATRRSPTTAFTASRTVS
jgi:DNA-binding transcriptional LysR family regulator